MIHLNKKVLNLVLLYIIYLFFYGIIIKFSISNPTIFMIKTYIPEIILSVIIVLNIINITINKQKNTKILISAFVLCLYSIFVLVLNFIINGLSEQAFIWIRDLTIPLITSVVLLNFKFEKKEIEHFFKLFLKICKLFLILGFILAVVQEIKGSAWSSSFYTGYEFYNQDSYSKIKIAHNMGLLRAPSLTGNYSTFAYYSCLSILVIINFNKNKKQNFMWILIALSNCLLSTNKSAILVLCIILFFRYTINIRKNNKILNIVLMFFLIIGTIFLGVLNVDNIFNESSQITGGFTERFKVWASILESVKPIEYLIPYKMFLYAPGSEFVLNAFDNMYLYILVSHGIIGLLLWIKYIKDLYYSECFEEKYILLKNNLMLFLLIIGLTSNIIQGRAFFNFILIIIPILNINIKSYKKMEKIKDENIDS